MIKGIIFDMDGVLINSEPYYFNSFLEMMKNDGKKVNVEDFKNIVGKSYDDSLAMVGEYYGEDFDGEKFLQRFDETYGNEKFNYKEILFSDIVELLDDLKSKGYKLAVASSSRRNVINEALEECGIKDYFEVVSTGEDFKQSKPNPEIYLNTAEKLGLKPWECIAVEDSQYGIKAGKSAKMTVVARKDFEFNINQDRADFLLNDLSGVSGILEIIKNNETNYVYNIFNYGSKKYLKSLFLRNNGLRSEFGLNIFSENLDGENDDLHFGIFDGENIIASIIITSGKEIELAQIKAVVVDENYRGKGIGKMIMTAGETLCKSLGFKSLILKAREGKTGFYENLGYQIDSDEYKMPPTNINHYNMIKNI